MQRQAETHVYTQSTFSHCPIWYPQHNCNLILGKRVWASSLDYSKLGSLNFHFFRMHSSHILWVGRRSRISCHVVICISVIKKVQKGQLISLFIKMGQCGAFSRTAIGRAGISEWGYWLVSKAWSLSLANCLVLYLGRKACTLLNETRESYYHSKLNRMALQECFLHNRVHTE